MISPLISLAQVSPGWTPARSTGHSFSNPGMAPLPPVFYPQSLGAPMMHKSASPLSLSQLKVQISRDPHLCSLGSPRLSLLCLPKTASPPPHLLPSSWVTFPVTTLLGLQKTWALPSPLARSPVHRVDGFCLWNSLLMLQLPPHRSCAHPCPPPPPPSEEFFDSAVTLSLRHL